MKYKTTPYSFLRTNWLLFGILCCIFAAGLYPKFGSKNGPLKTDLTVKYGAVCTIFFISGISLKTNSILETIYRVKLHFFIQFFTFIFVPLFAVILNKALVMFGVHPWVLKGLITVACMPPPVSSAVILTKAAQGNETAAIFNSILGSFLGILVTPMLLLFHLGSTSIVPLFDTVVQLIITVLVPIILGQLVKNCINLRSNLSQLNNVSQGALLFVIYTTFCDTFLVPETGLSALDVLFTVFSVLIMQLSLMLISFNLSKNHFQPSDIIAVVFCSTHKSLTLGIPILRLMFHGYSHLSQISLPLLVYHPTQIILGGLVVPQIKDWLHSCRGKRPPV